MKAKTNLKKVNYLNIRDRTNLIIALDRYINYISLYCDGKPAIADKRYIKYLNSLRKKL